MVATIGSSSKYLGAIDKEIRKCRSWDEFIRLVEGQRTTKDKGDLSERLTQLYLQSLPEYRTKLSNVWRLSEVPPPVARRLNLPALDEGIDLIAKTTAGEFWSIQCEYRSDTDAALTTRDLSKFSNLSFTYSKGIDLGVPFTQVQNLFESENYSARLQRLDWHVGLPCQRKIGRQFMHVRGGAL